ncbi:NACHT domain-containing protein [Leptothoe sp. PORK10 BA2]|uniref:NACHT domain-containing protein n=1 Tax=Leptothoe sp. PORK10 BA2 TaxID=3110254 RepID=UPI002B212BE9|nr:NACHT domain-containing protein [Leptothoe sp. PORK10 BA2]MEA5466033.1 NACHT domain-containing protein [Leptothoe sp. PORK10 BA2]
MPKLSYGPAAKQRTLALLMALVDYGNDELEVADEKALERLRSHLNVHWATDRQLIVRTTIRHLEVLSQLVSGEHALSKAQIKTALHHLEHYVALLEDNRTSRRGSDVWHFTLTLGGHRRDRTALVDRFHQTWEQRRSGQPVPAEALKGSPLSSQLSRSDSPAAPNPWQQRCQRALEAAHGLTSNLLTPNLGHGVADLHRPLTLVEHSLHPSPEKVSVATDQLLNQLEQQQMRQLAIVGEPGAGKTTLLQRLAQQILAHTPELAIVIPLAQLGTQCLEGYILGDWLKLALGKRTVPSEVQGDLAAQIEQGRVWLLLDAVDEMVDGGSVAIARLAQQLQGWLGHGPMVLTCRLNLWDAGKNALGHWPAYRLLGYESYGQQIKPFIRQWFSAQPEQGEALCQKLSLPEHKRLRNNLRNPLRLALFCRLGSGGQLPGTQHQLYQQFVTALYDWQQDSLPTTLLEQHHINQTLSKLAVATLHGFTVQFNLSLVTQTLLEIELPWFERAVQLGWLTPLPTTTGEKVYSFLHGTFRDYFAAQAIDRWQQFTTVVAGGLPMVLSHWQAVILLWLGRSDIPMAEKNEFMVTLVQFQDGCGQFFEHRAWLLAGYALGEHADCPQGDEIIQRLMAWRFNLTRQVSPILIEAAKEALAESDLERVVQGLSTLAQDDTQNFLDRWMAAWSLGRSYVPQSEVAVKTLETLLLKMRSDDLKMDMARHLGSLVPDHPLAIEVLVNIIETTPKGDTQCKAALRLAQVAAAHPLPMVTLEKLVVENSSSQSRLNALAQLKPDHPLVVGRAVGPDRMPKPRYPKQRKQKHRPDPSRLMESILSRLEQGRCDRKQLHLARQLNQLQPGHSVAIDQLWQWVAKVPEDMADLKLACEILASGATDAQIPGLVTKLRPIYEQSINSDQGLVYFKLLWAWADALGYQKFHTAWHAKRPDS